MGDIVGPLEKWVLRIGEILNDRKMRKGITKKPLRHLPTSFLVFKKIFGKWHILGGSKKGHFFIFSYSTTVKNFFKKSRLIHGQKKIFVSF